MPTKKRSEGNAPLPPRIDASPEAIANVVLNAGRPKGPVSGKAYYCVDCERKVSYPETLYQDGRCEQCHNQTERSGDVA